ncbi:MAG: M56 family metallopeptidase [Acidobacteriaceae bacterium]
MTAMMIEAALRGLVLAAMVGAGLGVLRVTNVPVRKAAWTLVLVGSMAMPFLMRWPVLTGLAARFGWAVPIHRTAEAPLPSEIRILPTTVAVAAAPLDTAVPEQSPAAAKMAPITDPTSNAIAVPTPVITLNPAATDSPAARRTWQWPPLERLIPMIYLAVCGALLLRLLWGLGAAWWIWTRAEEVSPLVAPEPNVRVSPKVPSPVTIGSGVVLPANYEEWGRAKLRVVLAHERSHVRQMDFYLQLLAGLYTAFFWFTPLGWWLKRSLSALGEAISDRAGMEVASSRSDYAGVLLEFAAMPRRALPGVAMARAGNLSRRVEGLLNENLFRKAFAEGRRRAMISLLLVPAALFAVTALVRVPGAAAQTNTASRTPTPPVPNQNREEAQLPLAGQSNPPESQVSTMDAETGQNPAAPPAAQAPAAAADMPAPQPAPAPQVAPGPTAGNSAVPEAAPAPEAPQDVPEAMTLDVGPTPEVWMKVPKIPDMKIVMPKIPDIPIGTRMLSMMAGGWGNNLSLMEPYGSFYLTQNGGMNGYAYHFSSNGDSWAVVNGAGKNANISGDGISKDQLDLAQRMAKGPFLWFTHDGKSYMVDDPSIVARIQSLYAPMKELGPQQEALGIQQRVLGKMEAELARSQREQASVRVPDLSKEMADAKAALDSLQSEQGQMLSEQKLAEMQGKLAEMEARLGSLEAGAAMQNNFAQRMRALGDQQRQLGEQQRQLGEQQKKLSEQAEQQVQSIIQQCLQNGKATPLK